MREATAAHMKRDQERRAQAMASPYVRADYEAQMTRRWKVGDVYAPHDLSGVEMAKWKKNRKKGRMAVDVVDALGIKPLEHYKVGATTSMHE